MSMKVNGVWKGKKPESLKNELKQSIRNDVANVKRLKTSKVNSKSSEASSAGDNVKNIV